MTPISMTPSSADPQGAYFTGLLTQLPQDITISLCLLWIPLECPEYCVCLRSDLLSLRETCRSPLPTHCYLPRGEKYSIVRNTVLSKTGA